jgi:hypothetical protein
MSVTMLPTEDDLIVTSDDPTTRKQSSPLRTLGGCWIAYGFVRLVLAFLLVLYNGTATVMFGALLSRVPNPFALMSVFHFAYIVMIGLSVVCGILGLLAGAALVAGQRSGRMLGLIAGFLSLSNIPLGTTLGIYTLIILLFV